MIVREDAGGEDAVESAVSIVKQFFAYSKNLQVKASSLLLPPDDIELAYFLASAEADASCCNSVSAAKKAKPQI